ncbi:MAG: hypothetical protein ACPG5B_06855 [Chitinophagales bacterium]
MSKKTTTQVQITKEVLADIHGILELANCLFAETHFVWTGDISIQKILKSLKAKIKLLKKQRTKGDKSFKLKIESCKMYLADFKLFIDDLEECDWDISIKQFIKVDAKGFFFIKNLKASSKAYAELLYKGK